MTNRNRIPLAAINISSETRLNKTKSLALEKVYQCWNVSATQSSMNENLSSISSIGENKTQNIRSDLKNSICYFKVIIKERHGEVWPCATAFPEAPGIDSLGFILNWIFGEQAADVILLVPIRSFQVILGRLLANSVPS